MSQSPVLRRNRTVAAATVALTTLGLSVGALTIASSAGAAPLGPQHVYRTSLTKAQIAEYSKDQNKRVVVLFKNQDASTLSAHALGTRAAHLERAQDGVRAELASLHSPHVHQYRFVNAVAAQVSAAEAEHLAADPDVEAVVPDAQRSLAPITETTTTKAAPHATTAVNTTPGICGTAKNPLLEPEALGQIRATTVPATITGKGVKVAVFPDGLDPDIKDFTRADGTHAIFDYRDFSGDGPDGVTSGAEAFGDASSIIAQGRTVYDISKVTNTGLPLPSGCDIRVKGVAPGASLAVMKIFGAATTAPDSQILLGMDWAVSHDHVNILSESFGSNPLPNAGDDPIAVFNGLAIKSGITVVASSGDSGITNTVGSPASSANGVISVGATTSFRAHAQVSEHGYQLGGYKGWESTNIATLSSGGFTDYGPNSVDVVAPGDSNWASCSTDTDTFVDCAGGYGGSADAPGAFQFGGTSESCPLTAGVAALVIQSYRAGHHNATPSPSVVKRIITSTANDLDMPVEEQGAGQVDAARAVQLARLWGVSKPNGTSLAVSPSKISTTGTAGSSHTATLYVRNESGYTRTVTPTLDTFSAPTTIGGDTFTYDPSSASTPTFTYWLDGKPEPYVEQDFTVPAGYQRLNVRFGNAADQTDAAQSVFEVLFDPSGRLAQDSDPQGGPLGFGQGDVRNPQAGKWRAIFFSRPGSDKYSGPITYQATVQKRVAATGGSVSPSRLTLKPNADVPVTVKYTLPATAGDKSYGVDFGTGTGTVPVLTRAVAAPTVATPATFSGELTTGNGRQALPTQELPFQFTVPSGVKDVDIDVHVADAGYRVRGLLVAPSGNPVDSTSTAFADITKTNPTESLGQDLHLSWQRPRAGTWEIDLASEGGSSSGKVATTVTGTIAFNTVSVTSSGVPASANTTLTAGTTTTARITVKNTGTAPKIYFVDPRRDGQSTYSLGFDTSPNGTLPETGDAPTAVVPPGTSSVTMIAHATDPVYMTTGPSVTPPDATSTKGTTAVATVASTDIPATEWGCNVSLIGPFADETDGGSYGCAAFATTDTIDDSVAATGGNVWDSFTDPDSPNVFTPADAVVVQPGASTTLTVTFTPSEDDEDSVVSGYLAVQSFDAETFSGDDLVHIPYAYTDGEPATS